MSPLTERAFSFLSLLIRDCSSLSHSVIFLHFALYKPPQDSYDSPRSHENAIPP